MPFSSIPEILDELRAGKMIVLVDDEDRENEGDLVMAAEKVTPAAINFMVTHARGADLPAADGGAMRSSCSFMRNRSGIRRGWGRRLR